METVSKFWKRVNKIGGYLLLICLGGFAFLIVLDKILMSDGRAAHPRLSKASDIIVIVDVVVTGIVLVLLIIVHLRDTPKDVWEWLKTKRWKR